MERFHKSNEKQYQDLMLGALMKRIREDCKRLEEDILISQDLLNSIEGLSGIKAVFVEETIPRGKAKSVRLYSLEKEIK